MVRSIALATLTLTGAVSLAAAQGSLTTADASRGPNMEIVSEAEQPAWNAVGRVNIAGYKSRRMCSGVLVRPNVVLTAAHCVMKGRRPAPASEVIFGAGWRSGQTVADSTGVEITVHPEFLSGVDGGRVAIGTDLAVITLAAPLPIAPLPVRALPELLPSPLPAYDIVGYRADRPHIATRLSTCRLVERIETAFATDCEVARGTSGAPVLDGASDGPAVVGVISAARLGGSLAAIPAEWLNEVLP